MEIQDSSFIKKQVERELLINGLLYNACLGELLKREEQMKRTKTYKHLRRQSRALSKKLSFYEGKTKLSKEDKEMLKRLKTDKKDVITQLINLQQAYGLSEYSIHAFVTPMRKHFQSIVGANVAQKTATRAWKVIEKKLKGEAKTVQFYKRGTFSSFEEKTNTTGWIYKNRAIVYRKNPISLVIKKQDTYMQEALSYLESEKEFTYQTKSGEQKTATYKVKYVRIVKRVIRGRTRYYAQLVCQGYPPPKRDNNGAFRYRLGKGTSGGDIGTSTMAFVSDKRATLFNLGEQIKLIDNVQRKITLLQRKLDRSRRATNPDNYNEDGTIKKGKKTWTYSKRYYKTKTQLTELFRKLRLYRLQSHQRMANRLLQEADTFYVEKMNIRALQKRAKETKVNEKTGKIQKKKRFGKSIAHRAPALFLSILKQKVESQGGSFHEVNTISFKASQYDHVSDSYTKKELKERWHVCADGTRIQRDLYSAFLLQNSNQTGTKANRTQCIEKFPLFIHMHEKEVKRIEQLPKLTLNSGITLKKTLSSVS